jgi:hypothetical protein
MPLTVDEYLQRISPVYRTSYGRWVEKKGVSESRRRTFKAVKEVLLAGGGASDLRSAVALTLAAAARHGAEVKDVWRHVRRYRNRIHNQAEQLKLPI